MKVEVSIGELADKITILELKLQKLNAGDARREHAQYELSHLLHAAVQGGLEDLLKDQLLAELKRTNLQLWETLDVQRAYDDRREYGREFVRMSQSVYQLNDRRFLAKAAINRKYDSRVREVKAYDHMRSVL